MGSSAEVLEKVTGKANTNVCLGLQAALSIKQGKRIPSI